MDDSSRRFGLLQLKAGTATGSERREALASLREIAEGDSEQAPDAASFLEGLAAAERPSARVPDRWHRLNFSEPPKPPQWLVPDLLARGWITLTHGKPKSGKSQAALAIVAAALTDGTFLGRPVTGVRRILVIDEENPVDVVNVRLKAMGYEPPASGADDRLFYLSQSGFKIGLPDWNTELLEFTDRYRPDYVVIDSMFRATTATGTNESIVPLFDVFRHIANRGAAVHLVHHNTKYTAEGDILNSASGGDQWMAQIDRQVAFTQTGPMEESTLPAGEIRRTFPIEIEGGHTRMGSPFPKVAAAVVSESDPSEPDMPVRMWIEEREHATESTPTERQAFRPTWYIEKAGEILKDQPGLTFNGLHKQVGRKREYLRRALDVMIEEGTVRVEGGDRNSQIHYLSDDRSPVPTVQ